MIRIASTRRILRLALMLFSALSAASYLAAQDDPTQDSEPEKRLIERAPFDRVILNDANDNAVLVVEPIPFPQRRIPEKRTGELKLGVLRIDSAKSSKRFVEPEPYKVAWRDIEEIELYEQMVLSEANQLVADANSTEAYEYFAFLLSNYPRTLGLEESLQTYYFEDARSLARQRRFHTAMSLLEDLHARNPNYRHPQSNQQVNQALAKVVNFVFDDYVKINKYGFARSLLERIGEQYADDQREIVEKCQGELQQLSLAQMAVARQHFSEDRLLQALDTARRAKEIWPATPGCDTLLAEFQEKNPLVVVGVTEMSPHSNRRALADWAARRTGYLTQRMFAEFTGYGPEGGEYTCPLGGFNLNEDNTRLTIYLTDQDKNPGALAWTGYEVSQRLLSLLNPTSPEYFSPLSSLVSSVEVHNVTQVHLHLRHPHVQPQALLQLSVAPLNPSPTNWSAGSATHVLKNRSDIESYYVIPPELKSTSGSRRPEIVERLFSDSNHAADALRNGDVDILDWITPADAALLRRDDHIVVNQYSLPTIHVLVPNTRKPQLASRTFRRAIAYGVNRPLILNELLRGAEVPDCKVISGPFPKGVSGSEGLGYAYNDDQDEVELRPYNPLLAIALGEMARREITVAAQRRGETSPPPSPLILGHLPSELPRKACKSIAAQLNPLKIHCLLLELPPGFSVEPNGEWLLFRVKGRYDQALAQGNFPKGLRDDFSRHRLTLSPKVTVSNVKVAKTDKIFPGQWRLFDEDSGITYEIRSHNGLMDVSVDGDLLYVELAMWEPLVDIKRLFGEGGVAKTTNPYVNLAIRDVQLATNWKAVSDQMHLLHRTVHDELAVIPLWQMINHFAHRRELSGVDNNPVVLYQGLEHWNLDLSKAPSR